MQNIAKTNNKIKGKAINKVNATERIILPVLILSPDFNVKTVIINMDIPVTIKMYSINGFIEVRK